MSNILPLIVIVGSTASGKTSAAIELAKRYGGEIICADSRTVYRGMDIGTAKPTTKERSGVTHWGLDLVEPGERFTVVDFQIYANNKIREIRDRGHIPIMVGGTGLYVNAVIFDYHFPSLAGQGDRESLMQKTVDELKKYCGENNIIMPRDVRNKRRIIGQIERNSAHSEREARPADDTIIVGIATDIEQIRTRIAARSEQLFDHGVVEEAIRLGKKYGWESEAMTGNIYPLVREHLEGNLSLDAVVEKFVILDRHLAKRQMTWLRRNPYIEWCGLDDVARYAGEYLATEYNL